ncbi:FAD-dependent monooxygenase [Amycolatopsis sp. CA-230715]|uniref:FAD-dependent monooxygenase n=1 Tax=Amycolatopsis sp. CA-230715 TaxID=2745196 RepID=UPI001C02238A|nr:FAD-dependent monooxygenase [Amycolatopsis sp. CA-230715]QWF84665.1 Anhydrotetracycline monooxygenase [Amycolatopsis sp. CA-230715]
MDADVIVAGGGPVGLFLAAELALAGARTLVLERLDSPTEELRARGLGVLAGEMLTRRGLGELLAEAHERGFEDLKRDHGSSLGHFAHIHKLDPALTADPGRRYTYIWQPELTRLLAAHAARLGVTVHTGHEVTGFESDVDGVVVRAGGRRFRARYLVGCDGGRSSVRKLAGFDFPGTPALLRTIGGRARLDGDIPPGGRYETGTFIHGGGTTVGMVGTGELDATAPALDGPPTADDLEASIRRVTGAEVTVTELHDFRVFADRARQVSTYRIGRVLLAGDAAHIHSPNGGQGLNLGLMDAANLGWKLAAVVKGEQPEALLDTYTAERHPAGESVLRNTRAQSALLAPGPHVDALREIIAELMDIPEANRYFSDLLSAVNLRYDLPYPTEGELTGRHCPDLELVDDDGRASRLHEHTLTGRGLLLLPPENRDLAELATGPVDVLPIAKTGLDDGALLLRPDGVVAWAGSDRETLRSALETWFGKTSSGPV